MNASLEPTPFPTGVNPAARARRGGQGFSLAELLVAVSLLSVVVLALLSVFNQTQKAFKSSLNQVDIDEAARATLDMIARDIEQAAVAGFATTPTNGTVITNMVIRYDGKAPLALQNLPGFGLRANAFHEIFYWTRSREQPYAFEPRGYFVGPDPDVAGAIPAGADPRALRPEEGIGTLYRFDNFPTNASVNGAALNSFTNRPATRQGWASTIVNSFFQWNTPDTAVPGRAVRTNAARILDGVVLFRTIPCDAEGRVIDPSDLWYFNSPLLRSNLFAAGVDLGVNAGGFPVAVGSTKALSLKFARTSLPAYIDIELGVIEPATLATLRSFPSGGDPAIRRKFVERYLGKVQIFRQRIPLRAAPRLP